VAQVGLEVVVVDLAAALLQVVLVHLDKEMLAVLAQAAQVLTMEQVEVAVLLRLVVLALPRQVDLVEMEPHHQFLAHL
jgi:hypothetical protein